MKVKQEGSTTISSPSLPLTSSSAGAEYMLLLPTLEYRRKAAHNPRGNKGRTTGCAEGEKVDTEEEVAATTMALLLLLYGWSMTAEDGRFTMNHSIRAANTKGTRNRYLGMDLQA